TVVDCLTNEDNELRNKFQEAFVFHVAFESDTSIRPSESDPFLGIGSQMLLQLLPGMELEDVSTDFEAPEPLHVLRLVATYYNRTMKDLAFIVVVDGMQQLIDTYDDEPRLSSPFCRTLTAIGDLTQKGIFLLPCCTATVTRPVIEGLKSSRRRRVYLPVAPLGIPTINGLPIFDPESTLLRILSSDCDGRRRALELLWDLTKDRDMQIYNDRELMIQLRKELAAHYNEVLPDSDEAKAIMYAVLNHQLRLNESNSWFFGFDKKYWATSQTRKKYPDQLVEPGLIRFEKIYQDGYFHVSYIWLFAMAEGSGRDSLLVDWRFDDYYDLSANEDLTLPTGCSWDNFKKINAKIRNMKSLALNDGQ
ncbi:hypothetical protein BGZ79_008528, partial [Entomortierella chlamydospora]